MFSAKRVRTRPWLAAGYSLTPSHQERNSSRCARGKVRCEQETAPTLRERHGLVVERGYERTERPCFGWEIASAALGEFAVPHASHGANFGQAVLHRGDDVIGERNLGVGRRWMWVGRRQTMNLRGRRSTPDPGFECIELMLEVRERLLQTSQFFRAGILMHTIPGRCAQDEALDRRACASGGACNERSLSVEKPPCGGLSTTTRRQAGPKPSERGLDSSVDRPGSQRRGSPIPSLPR